MRLCSVSTYPPIYSRAGVAAVCSWETATLLHLAERNSYCHILLGRIRNCIFTSWCLLQECSSLWALCFEQGTIKAIPQLGKKQLHSYTHLSSWTIATSGIDKQVDPWTIVYYSYDCHMEEEKEKLHIHKLVPPKSREPPSNCCQRLSFRIRYSSLSTPWSLSLSSTVSSFLLDFSPVCVSLL